MNIELYKNKFIIVTISFLVCMSAMAFVPQVHAAITSNEGDGWADVEMAWFAKTRHGGAGGFRASVGIDPTTSQGQNGWFAGGWTWTSGQQYHFRLEYDATIEIAELYVTGQNNGNPLCSYNVGPSEGRIGINARTAPEAGRSTIIENIMFNGVSVGPDDSVTATSSSGESAVRHLLIEGADITSDFILEGDFTFKYGTSTHDECPSMVIDVENSEPCIPDIPVNSGYDPDAVCSNGARWRNFRTDGNGWELAVGENIGSYDPGWANYDFVYAADYYFNPAGPNIFTYTYDAGTGDQTIEAEVSGGLFTQTQNNGNLGTLDYLQFDVVGRNGQTVEFNNVMLTVDSTTYSLCDYSAGGWLSWYIDSLDLSNGFSITGEVWLTGQAASQEGSKINVCVGNSNLPPIAEANGPYSGYTIDTITLDSDGSYDPDGTIVSYTWFVDSVQVYTGPDPTYDLDLGTYVEGVYDVELIVEDDSGLIDNDTTTVTVYWTPPVAEANGPYSGYTIDTITLDSDGSYDPDGTIVSYTWFVDSVQVYTGPDPTYDLDLGTYVEGVYDVELIVEDNDGMTGIDTTLLAVEYLFPVADAGGPYDAYYEEGYIVSFDGSGSYDLDGTIVSYHWDFGDGNTGSGVNPVHSYDNGFLSRVVTLTVTDNHGLIDVDTATITYHGEDEFAPIIQLIYPVNGEVLSNTETVRWYAIDDTLRGEELPIELFYSNNGLNWIKLTDDPLCNNIDIEHGSYEWDTRKYSDGTYYLKGVVKGTGGTDRDTSKSFTIDNQNAGIIIPDVIIEDISIENCDWVKDGDTVVITATITGHDAEGLSEERITADLSCFGGNENVHPNAFNGFIATWMVIDVKCSIESGEVSVPILIDNEVFGRGTITVDNIAPEVLILKPKKGVYLKDIRLLPFGKTYIIGGLNIQIDTVDNGEIDFVEFSVDNVHMMTDTIAPYTWFMNMKTVNGNHVGTITLSDKAGNSISDSFEFTMFNPNGELW